MQFGLSTHLFHDRRLAREHFVAIRAHGFAHVEVFATRTHFDYHDPTAVDALAGWIDAAGLRLHAIHAPVVEGYRQGVWGAALSNATTNASRREAVLRETEVALTLARRLPCSYLVAHLGQPDSPQAVAGDNHPEAARRSVDRLRELAEAHGVQLALEVIPNRLSTVPALVRLLEDPELAKVGICLDFGHAFLTDDLVDAIELAAGHVVTTHVHDNRRATDDHLVPFEGHIDWARALYACQKVGYEGVWIMELANTSSPEAVLARARSACARFEEILAS